jgi:hypothetical protein
MRQPTKVICPTCGAERTVAAFSAIVRDCRSCANTKRRAVARGGLPREFSKSRLYGVWVSMRNRCTNPNNQAFANYGGRGITVCERWQSFDAFVADMGPGYGPGLTVERIDNDGDYEPGNVIWATMKEQRRNARLLTYEGETMVASDWAKRTGLGLTTILARMDRGWPVEDVLSVSPPALLMTHNGETKRLSEWAAEYGINYFTLRNRFQRGWSAERCLDLH